MTGKQYFRKNIGTFSVFRSISIRAFAVLCAAAVFTVFSGGGAIQAAESRIIAQDDIAPMGLSRIWFNQVTLDSSRSKVLHAILEGDAVFVVTSNALLTSIDSATGKTNWVRRLGNRDSSYEEPAVNSRMVAVQNATDIFIFDRRNGKLLLSINLPGTSSTSCELSENYAYIPLIDGRLAAYPLIDIKAAEGSVKSSKSGVSRDEGQAAAAEDDMETDEDSPAKSTEKEEFIENIKKQFAEVKSKLYPVEKPEPNEIPIVLERISGIPMITQSFGIITVKPKIASQIVTLDGTKHHEIVTWVNNRGFLLAANITALSREKISLQYKIDTSGQHYFLGADRIAQREITAGKEIAAQPVLNQSVPPLYSDGRNAAIQSSILFGTKSGFVIAVKDRTGEILWQFAANGPVSERIGIIGAEVYAATAEGLHAVDFFTGNQKWFARGVARFVTASKTKIYGVDRNSQLVVLDRKTGRVLRSFNVRKYGKILFNIETDRLYLITETGMVQCLAERQLREDAAAEDITPIVQHRYNCAQNAVVFGGGTVPELYWMAELAASEDGAEKEDTEEKE
ncbi:MAG: PQQ-binding-like beta-propeller repeat protein [Planctomycetaceae bacterium]|nr:PQQ-binding-like beta-propeller repeat protein [Planctomycetaceae bacterium]